VYCVCPASFLFFFLHTFTHYRLVEWLVCWLVWRIRWPNLSLWIGWLTLLSRTGFSSSSSSLSMMAWALTPLREGDVVGMFGYGYRAFVEMRRFIWSQLFLFALASSFGFSWSAVFVKNVCSYSSAEDIALLLVCFCFSYMIDLSMTFPYTILRNTIAGEKESTWNKHVEYRL
jgi:hypothetical protein